MERDNVSVHLRLYTFSFIHGRSHFYLAVDVVVYVQLGLERIFSFELTNRVV